MSAGTAPLDAAALHRRAGRENFPVAPRVLPRDLRTDLSALYGYARLVDDLGDEQQSPAALDQIDADLDRLFAGDSPLTPVLQRLAPTVRAHDLDRGPFDRLLAANRRDQGTVDYQTYDDLLGYCVLSANPVGELVLAIFDAVTPDRIERSDAICTALQLIEHCQDVAEDAGRGRVYLPAEDRQRFRVGDDMLTAPRTSPRLRGLVAFELGRAADLLDRGTPLVGSLNGWARLAVAGYVGGGRAAAAALHRIDHAVTERDASPRRSRVALETARVLLGGAA